MDKHEKKSLWISGLITLILTLSFPLILKYHILHALLIIALVGVTWLLVYCAVEEYLDKKR